MSIRHTSSHWPKLMLFGLVSLSASGLAGAHGAPDAENVPDGIVKARITEQPSIPGLSAMILDAPRPGILMRYKGEETLTVLDTDNEAFLQFDGKEVKGHTQSKNWDDMPDALTSDDQTGWVALSQSGSYGWMDPRLNTADASHHGDKPLTWSIPIRTESGEITKISGTLTYKRIQPVR